MNKDTIKDSVRDLVANWRNEADRKLLDAVTCAATSSDSGFDPGKLLEQLSSPWAYPPIPDRAVAGHGAFDRLAALGKARAEIANAMEKAFYPPVFAGLDIANGPDVTKVWIKEK